MTTLRVEIRAIVSQAKQAGKPITSQIIWGLLSREVPRGTVSTMLGIMCRSQELVSIPGEEFTYEPGAVQRPDGKTVERASMSMGFMERRRLMDARAAARKWCKQKAAA